MEVPFIEARNNGERIALDGSVWRHKLEFCVNTESQMARTFATGSIT
jgi:hypothetical protein